jgi:hypothetical protein
MLGYRHSAFTTWEISFERITPISPPSAFLLQLLGFVYNQDIGELLYNPKSGTDLVPRQLSTFRTGLQFLRSQIFGKRVAIGYYSKIFLALTKHSPFSANYA